MSLTKHALLKPNKHALIMESSGRCLTYAELDANSQQIAHLLRRTLSPGDRFGLLHENSPAFFEVSWAARRSALRWVPINWHLRPNEVAYVVKNSDAKILVASASLSDLAIASAQDADSIQACFSTSNAFANFQALSKMPLQQSAPAFSTEQEGIFMFYSSGTTGRPKGILRPLPEQPFGTPLPIENIMHAHYGMNQDTVFYCPGPLYHAAPLGWTMGAQLLGGTVISAERFDAEETLKSIEKYGVTHAKFVPTHMIRMLKLPERIKRKYDYSSLRSVIHAAAPCPPEVKKAMIDWWGPIIHEFYGSSEGAGFSAINSQEWLGHPGSVGRVLVGVPHIVDEHGEVLPPGQVGQLCFEQVEPFEYHKDPEKTRDYYDHRGWAKTGDLARLDEEGYLYLMGRSNGLIISGGVNIYAQEIENVLSLHPLIADLAVVGVPDADLGEKVQAIVQLENPAMNDSEVIEELRRYCQAQLARFKCPAKYVFVEKLPRLPSGKLLNRYINLEGISADG
jgi:long-chain acyl-CoA synthetase